LREFTIKKAENGKVVFSMGKWFLHNSRFFADFHFEIKDGWEPQISFPNFYVIFLLFFSDNKKIRYIKVWDRYFEYLEKY
jgi:hypothetical protein